MLSLSELPADAPSKNKFDKTCRKMHKLKLPCDTAIHIALIYYLQEWNFSKKIERNSKVLLLGKNGDGLSAIEP